MASSTSLQAAFEFEHSDFILASSTEIAFITVVPSASKPSGVVSGTKAASSAMRSSPSSSVRLSNSSELSGLREGGVTVSSISALKALKSFFLVFNQHSGKTTPYGDDMIRFEFFDDEFDHAEPKGHDLDFYLEHLRRVGLMKITEMIKKHEAQGRPICCLINNPFILWVSDVAENLGIKSAMLWVQSCASFAYYYYLLYI
nr:hypothetical protein DM860_003191 [Ipomoea trifida]